VLIEENKEIEITIFISCYNEKDYIISSIENAIAALEEIGCSYEILVIDDASKDNSFQYVQEYQRLHPEKPIILRVNERNRGLGYNYVEGAFIGKGKYYRLICGDNAEPREVLVHIFKHIGKADMVIPYQNQKEVIGKSLIRKLLSITFTVLVNLISGYNIKYYNGGAIHLRYNVMRWHPSSYGFGFQADIITRLLDEGVSYVQIPSYSIHRKGSDSTALAMRNVLSVAHTLLEIAIGRLRKILYGKDMVKPIEVKLEKES
jgi:glycosyltransferase involved in cell wall biosynthesis